MFSLPPGLPDLSDHPLLWGPDRRAWLRGSPMLARLEARLQNVREDAAELVGAGANELPVARGVEGGLVTEESMRWVRDRGMGKGIGEGARGMGAITRRFPRPRRLPPCCSPVPSIWPLMTTRVLRGLPVRAGEARAVQQRALCVRDVFALPRTAKYLCACAGAVDVTMPLDRYGPGAVDVGAVLDDEAEAAGEEYMSSLDGEPLHSIALVPWADLLNHRRGAGDATCCLGVEADWTGVADAATIPIPAAPRRRRRPSCDSTPRRGQCL